MQQKYSSNPFVWRWGVIAEMILDDRHAEKIAARTREAWLLHFFMTVAGPEPRGHSGQCPQSFFVLPKFCCAEKNLFQTYNENKNAAHLKMYFPLKP